MSSPLLFFFFFQLYKIVIVVVVIVGIPEPYIKFCEKDVGRNKENIYKREMIRIIYIELQQTVILYYTRVNRTVSRPCLFYWRPFCRGFWLYRNLHNRTPFKTVRNHNIRIHQTSVFSGNNFFSPPWKLFVCRDAAAKGDVAFQPKRYNILNYYFFLNFFYSLCRVQPRIGD